MLKSLELFGFKSFADRTLFEFDKGVTCVVGPNGSGKSNVVDGIKWILGDQSPKSLRGKDMLDVIFNGAAGRKPSPFAEATLTFDNSQGLLPIESSEVQIGRRLYQSGDSEYLLNRNVVRLKDIRNLFMGTGAGTAAYSIIEQGRVDQILQANPTTRRLVFEEAAGISKFKSRRVESERRLERVEQNLVRLRDIVATVESQLHATRSQAGKATKYRELSVELEELWTGMAADDFRFFQEKLRLQEASVSEVDLALQNLQSAIGKVEARKRDTESELSQIEDQFLGLQRQMAAVRETIAGLDSTARHQSTREGELSHDLDRLRKQQTQLLLRLDAARTELQVSDERIVHLERDFEASRSEVEQREQQFTALQEQITQRRVDAARRREELNKITQRRSASQERLSVLNSQIAAAQQQEEEAQTRLEESDRALQAAAAERQQRAQILAEAEAAALDAQAKLDQMRADRETLTGQRSETDKRLNELRERRSAAAARLAVLEELEQRQEGIAIGVRDIVRRAESSHYPPWNSVLGLVRDLIDVPLEWAPVIEVALGDRAQLIAVTQLDPLLDYLNRGPAPIEGRVGFVSLQSDGMAIWNGGQDSAEVVDATFPDADFSAFPGVISRADRVVSGLARAEGLIERILGDTWIVDSLDHARNLLKQAPAKCRVVTLQGELLSSEGRLFLGTVPHESSIVSRKSELRQLRNEIHQMDRGIESIQERRHLLRESLSGHDHQLEEATAHVRTLTLRVTECTAHLTGQKRDASRLEKAYTEQLQIVEQLQLRRAELDGQLQSLHDDLSNCDLEQQQLQGAMSADEQELSEIESLLRNAQNITRQEQLELAKHEERLRALKEAQARLTKEQQVREQQTRDVSVRLQETQRSKQQTQLQILQSRNESALAFLQVEKLSSQLRDRAVHRDRLRRLRGELSSEEEELHKQRRQLGDARHAAEIEVRDVRHQLKGLADRIQEEYQTTLEDLVSRGVSAYGQYLQQRELELASEEAATDSGPLTYEELRPDLETQVDKLRRRIKALGHVNTEALESLEELEVRYETLSSQLQDLEEAKLALDSIISRINIESERIFLETFETIRVHFVELFRKLFGGGDADIILEDPEDVLECGLDIVARPPGKELRSISLLSGGEKTMTAVALLFAMFRSKPSPYCVLDEVDAALDEANVDRYATVLKEFVSMTQFVVITHRKRTMTAANTLYGVTMEQAGVSKRMSVRFEEVGEHGEIRSRSAA